MNTNYPPNNSRVYPHYRWSTVHLIAISFIVPSMRMTTSFRSATTLKRHNTAGNAPLRTAVLLTSHKE